jgi:hypothetical protein
MSTAPVPSVPNKMVIVACPVSRCEVRHIAGVGVLMAIRYVDKAEQFETGERTMLQALIDPEQALEIGEALRKSAQALELGKALKKVLKKSRRKSARLLPPPNSEEHVIAAGEPAMAADAAVMAAGELVMAESVSARDSSSATPAL